MAESTVSLRVNKKLHEAMKAYKEVNWSAVLRRSIEQTMERMEQIDVKEANEAARIMDRLRRLNAFSKGKEGTAIIREWRKRR